MTDSKFAKLVNKANKIVNLLEKSKIDEINLNFTNTSNGDHVTFTCFARADLPQSIFSKFIDIIERNMRDFYENSSWGWRKDEKLKEIDNSLARFLILEKIIDRNERVLIGFSHFRFDMDYGIAVLYCYELQMVENFQGYGYGTKFLDILVQICKHCKMHKCVVTVFKRNESSVKFFRKNGFSRDVTCPEDGEGVDYLILSKIVL